MIEFLDEHALECFTTVLGLIYLYFEYHASILLWLLGIAMPALDVYLFSTHGLYAYAGISMVFTLTAVYGWCMWKFGINSRPIRDITHIKKKATLLLLVLTLAVTVVVYFILIKFTDSEVPLLDSFTTAASLSGIIALSYKYVEQWLVWIVVDIISVVLFIEQGLVVRAGLYALYVIIAVLGYIKWKNLIKVQ